MAIALDPAASEFHRDGCYRLGWNSMSSDEPVDRYTDVVERYPVWSIEDGMGECDTSGWQKLTRKLGDRVQLVGDDNFVTNPELIAHGVRAGVANAALIKVNQIGTVTETLEALKVCRDAGYSAMISQRSGETDDTFIADLAVASGCGQIKAGARPAANGWPNTIDCLKSVHWQQIWRSASPAAELKWPGMRLGGWATTDYFGRSDLSSDPIG